MNSDSLPHFRNLLKHLLDGRDLSPDQVNSFLTDLVSQPFDEISAGAVLTAWRMRGEKAGEIAEAVRTMRRFQRSLPSPAGPVLDTCGTGGDESGTFNISTAVSLVVAGCGVRVVKHGNRAVSSRSGSADVLQELGVPIMAGPEWVETTYAKTGYAFCFAPSFHPALAKVGPLRRKLGVRTIFNLLGPLLNPAGAGHHLLGVGIPGLLDTLAGTLLNLECEQAILVSGRNRLDEVSLSGPTDVRIVSSKGIVSTVWTPDDFDLEPVELSEIQAADAVASAGIIRRVLEGEAGPALRMVLANAAAGLLAAGAVGSLTEGVGRAREAIRSGRANAVLRELQTSAADLVSA
ncbi:anthranilate phosphoribosyltransferase [Zavarzinella formosa]|uniref:anthranilate phosphoribosyltransferase n=1 Tax=Zavarzinella formosa TaxID=360055 RepID=UPI00030FD7CC|nr:anthranilate phosphoribosyltransferase [Zavarzinella formosa]